MAGISKKFIYVSLLLWLGLLAGCSSPPPTPTQPISPSPTIAPPPSQTPPPISSPTAEMVTPTAIASLVDIEKALIRIETRGKFFAPKLGNSQVDAGAGSGFIIDPSGLALTPSHAVTGADEIKVWVGPDARVPLPASLVAISECDDLALIDIEGDGFEYLAWSERPIEAGQKIYIAGFPTGSQQPATSRGEITGTAAQVVSERIDADQLLEYTTSNLPAGLAGAAVLSPDARLVGLHQGKIPAKPPEQLATPVPGETSTPQPEDLPEVDSLFGLTRDSLQALLERLRAGKPVASIGLNRQAVSDESGLLTGIAVSAVQPDSQAAQAGLQGGDLIISMNSQPVGEGASIASYCQLIRQLDPQVPVEMEVLRGPGNVLFTGGLNGKILAEYLAPTQVIGAGTPTPNLEAQKSGDVYFSEGFDSKLDKKTWDFFITSGYPEYVVTTVEDSRLVMTIDFVYTYPYYIYKPLKTSDVRLKIRADSQGTNNNNVTLVCRYSDKGWYEFNVANNGLYWIKRYDPFLPDIEKYVNLVNGGSFKINMGQKTNTYEAVCQGDQLTLLVNGFKLRTVKNDILTYGQVGFGAGSFNVNPVILEFDDFIASVP